MTEKLHEALIITHKINNEYHTPEEIQELFAELTLKPVNRTLGLMPPFNTDFGKNIHIGENVFINSGCKMQDQGGIYIGDDVLIGHKACLLTLNHAKEPENRADMYAAKLVGENEFKSALNFLIRKLKQVTNVALKEKRDLLIKAHELRLKSL